MDDPNDERRNRLDALSKEANEMSARKRELEKELKRATEPQKALARQFKLLKKEEDRASRSLLEANQRLQARRDEIVAKAGSAESDQARRNQRLQTAEKKLTDEKNRHNELRQAVTDAYNAYEDLEPEVLAARQMVSHLSNQLRGIEGKIKSMESSSENSLDIFGPRCARVREMVDRATQKRRFRGPVLGPIGSYCKIQQGKDDFTSLAELAIGNGVLDRFVVFNDADRKLFQQIRRDAGCQMDCGVFQQYQHPRYRVPEPPEGVETVATVISVQNDLVFNCLVDNAKIETKALFWNKKESEDKLLVKDRSNRYAILGGKIKEVYLLPKGDNWKVTKGNIQMISNTRRLKKTIGADVSAAIEDSKNDFEAMNKELTAKNRDYNRLEHEHTNHKTLWNTNKRELKKNEREIDRVAKEIEDIKAEEASHIDTNVDTTEEEEDVSAAQAHLDQIKENQRKAQDSIKENTPQIQAIKDNVDEITARNEKVLNDMREAEHNLSQHYQALDHQKARLAKKREKLQQYEELVAAHAEEIMTAQEETNQYLKLARHIQFCHNKSDEQRRQREANVQANDLQDSLYNVEPTDEDLELIEAPENLENLKNQEYYEDKIKHVNGRIRLEKERRLENSDDEATAYEKYNRAMRIFQAKQDQIDEIASTSKTMDNDLAMRRKRWVEFRDFISAKANLKFNAVRKFTLQIECLLVVDFLISWVSIYST
jgi:chromosome segregation ATPase